MADPAGKSLFVANRGEIAVRVGRAAKALGMEWVQAHSQADADMLAVREADRAVEIGPAQATKSYLDADRVVAAAKEAGAHAVHPGYGFLSENAAFARKVEEAGMIFVGPSADTIARMGDKVAAREAAIAAGVPVAQGSQGRVPDVDAAKTIAAEIGYPVMVKAAAGGGGRGIRVAESEADLARLFPQAAQEAQAAFGDGGLYIEQFIRDARHVEVQIMGDGTAAVHFYERECSLQRRRQKVWEEAPAACLTDAQRAHVCEASVRLAEAVSYRGAGTLEYLFDPARGTFAFLEMNTRIQVEHPVTEMITGHDLVAEMIRVAFGAPLSVAQSDIAMSGHSIEVRVNAEDPFNNFMPFPGVVSGLSVPEGVRFDTMLYEGYAIPPFYDSLIGKLIVKGEDRAAAIAALSAAIESMTIDGLKTTLPLHAALAADVEVQAGEAHTGWLEDWLAKRG
ncbi:acetyl-CoA carboxylase biotin carboxylase subunit [Albimonas sp. CAU 1670]|uniref:acetyl-CoA carboxylase biotin carboxylase subunit n=1 Tax=Albimonas sp. CAU 1670 TaxID=3032599 RepID=UPI0023DC7F14|nr:acetyl-CoA carboxylase biotin carboxylase subunit [Albimonas sp. CAU 1670]MDF2230949.1 acetyl-CoA carboxylase biotin carboxylase subunit [Albimonas sp. CAU 1670]